MAHDRARSRRSMHRGHVSPLVANDPYNAPISSSESERERRATDTRSRARVHAAYITIRVVERDIKASLCERRPDRPTKSSPRSLKRSRINTVHAGTFNRTDRSPNENMSLEGRRPALDYCLEIRRKESIYYARITGLADSGTLE